MDYVLQSKDLEWLNEFKKKKKEKIIPNSVLPKKLTSALRTYIDGK